MPAAPAANAFCLLPIANPFHEEGWNIDQVFQMSVFEEDKEHFVFGYYDNRMFCNVIQLGNGNNAKYFTAPDATSFGQILRLMHPDADSWRFTEVEWAGNAGAQLPAANAVNQLLALRMSYIHDSGSAASFVCHVLPRIQLEVAA